MYKVKMKVIVVDRDTNEVLINEINHEFARIAPSPFLSTESAKMESVIANATLMFLARLENQHLISNSEYALAVKGRLWKLLSSFEVSPTEPTQFSGVEVMQSHIAQNVYSPSNPPKPQTLPPKPPMHETMDCIIGTPLPKRPALRTITGFLETPGEQEQ